MDVIDFLMHKEGCTKNEALEKCKALIGGTAPAPKLEQLTRTAVLTRMFTYFKNADRRRGLQYHGYHQDSKAPCPLFSLYHS
jgi:hypothetical protein